MTDDAFRFPTTKDHPPPPGLATPAEADLAGTFNDAIDRAAERYDDMAGRLKDRLQRTGDTTIGYIRDEPWKSLLMAAAIGAAVVGLVSLLASDRD